MSFQRPEDIDEAVVVYTGRWCGFCTMAKRLLEHRSIPYVEVDTSQDPASRAWLVDATGQRTIPQIFIKGESIGGYRELAQLDQGGQLREKLVG